MRFTLAFLSTLVFASLAQAQTGPCTESTIKQGNCRLPMTPSRTCLRTENPLPASPQYRMPIRKASQTARNIKFIGSGEHRIVASTFGDMAYEHTRRS
jgi:hypothetical protein